MKSAAAPILASCALLAACSDPQPAGNATSAVDVTGVEAVPPADGDIVSQAPANAAAGVATQAAYLGRWTGVEGMYLDVAAKPGGGVSLDMQWDLDNRGTFDGTVTAEGLRFIRNGVAEAAVLTDGDATGLKWLAGKTHCLTVKSGEGYCRD